MGSNKYHNEEPQMDEVIIQVFSRMARIQECSSEDILEDPSLREKFLAETRLVLGNLPERDLLHRLSILRKRSKLPRTRDLVVTTQE